MRGYSILVVALFGSSCLAAALPEPAALEGRGGRCKEDACLDSLLAQGYPQAPDDCNSFRQKTVTPRPTTTTTISWKAVVDTKKTITKTVTNYATTTTTAYTTSVTETDTTETSTATVSTATYTQYKKRVVGKQQGGIPNYANGPCSATAQYTSACNCIHATGGTTTAPRPTVTKTSTRTRYDCVTVFAYQTIDDTQTSTTTSTTVSTSTSTTTTTTSVTATATVSPNYPVFTLGDMYNVDKQISVAAGPSQFNLIVGPSAGTPFYVDNNNILHSYANAGQSVGYCPNTNPTTGGTNIFTYPVSSGTCQQGGSIIQMMCTLFGNTTIGSSGTVTCSTPGFQHLGACGGSLIAYNQQPVITSNNYTNTTNTTNIHTGTNTTTGFNTTTGTNTTNTTNSTTTYGCTDLYTLNLMYTIVDPSQPVSTRRGLSPDADYQPPQRRRKNRPDVEAPKVYERGSASE